MPLKNKFSKSATKRGDTIIEAMFAFAVFSLVSIVTVSMMNLGISASERSLELTTVRNELNAQAEALRFIHSSYISELSLPRDCAGNNNTATGCQHYTDLWDAIVDRSIDTTTIEYPLSTCSTVYESENDLLKKNHAFIINPRALNNYSGMVSTNAIISSDNTGIFTESVLNARVIYGSNIDNDNSSEHLDSRTGLSKYTTVERVEGIWVIPVKGPKLLNSNSDEPQYYDFYIETCWYGSGNSTPTSLDTIVRLYNPKGIK